MKKKIYKKESNSGEEDDKDQLRNQRKWKQQTQEDKKGK